MQNHKQVKDLPSGNLFFFFLNPKSVVLFKLVLVTYVPLQPTPLSVFVSQLYFSCKVMQLQLASIWQGFFFCLSPALESYIHRANQFKR